MHHQGKPVQAVPISQRNAFVEDNKHQIQCWVPGCCNTDRLPRKIFYSLPTDPRLRDLWLAAAGKAYHDLQNIWFCKDHFSVDIETSNSLPVCNMPQKRCRTCLAPIQNKKYCVLSPNINSKMPASIEHLFGSTYSRPLIEVLQFCVPEMTIEMNPVPVCCYNCYNSMWIYYFFKQRCIYQEKTLMEVYRGRYGNVVGCRACPSNDHKNVVLLNGNYELEILLTSMFGNDGPSTSIPLQLCPRCIPILKDIQEFKTICLRTQDIVKQLGSNQQHSQAVVEEPTVPINKDDVAQKQLLLGKLMLENGMGLKDKSISEAQQANIWNIIQRSFVEYGYTLSVQSIKDTWSMMILEYTLGRLKGSELGNIMLQYVTTEYPNVPCKPLKKRYRAPSTHSGDSSSNNARAVEQNATVEESIIAYRIGPKPIGVFEPNIIPPPSCSVTLPPPYTASFECSPQQRDATTDFCSPMVEPETAVNLTVRNCTPEYQTPLNVNDFLLNKASNHGENVKLKQPSMQCKRLQAAMSISTSGLNSDSYFGTNQSIPLMPIVSKHLHSTAITPSTIKPVEPQTPHSLLNKASTHGENVKLKQLSRQSKHLQASSMSTSTSGLNSVLYFGTDQSIPLMPIASEDLHSTAMTPSEIKPVEPERPHSENTVLGSIKSDPSEHHNIGSATSRMSLIGNAKPSAGSALIDLTEDEDNMVQVANISSSWEDIEGNAETQTSDDVEFVESSKDDERKSDAEVDQPTDMRKVVIEGREIDTVGVCSVANTSKTKNTNADQKPSKKFIRKSHQTFTFQDKVDLIDAMKYVYEVSKTKGVLSANPWKKLLSELHKIMYDNLDENKLWRMWYQMRLSAKIHAKDGSDYVDTEVWNLLEKHSNYLKNRKNLTTSPSLSSGKQSDEHQGLEEKSDLQDNKVPERSIHSPSKSVQTLISSYCKVEQFDKKINFPTKAQISSCASIAKQTDPKPGDVKESVELEAKPLQAKMDILTIEIDSDTDFSDGNNDYRDPAAEATAPLSPAKIWTDFEKNAFFKSVKVEFGAMLNNNENISNPWKTIIERLHKSQYSMYSLKELLKVWRKIRMDAHLHENNNAMFGTPLDIEVNRLIKLLHTIKEAKRTSKLTSAKSAERLEDKHDSKPKNACKSKPAAPEKKKRKKRPLTLSKVKKDKKPKLALPPLDPNRLEEDKEGAEKTEWSEKEQRDLVSIVETTGNEVFKPDVPKQFWSNVRTKMIEKGHNERSVGALYYKWNRLLESAKLAWADQKAKNSLDQAVIEFLTELIKSNVKKPYGPEENDGISASRPSSLSGEISKDSQQSELHSVDQNKSDKMLISNKSSVSNENSELYKTIQENKQENVENEVVEQETEDDGSESEDEYVSAADILKM